MKNTTYRLLSTTMVVGVDVLGYGDGITTGVLLDYGHLLELAVLQRIHGGWSLNLKEDKGSFSGPW